MRIIHFILSHSIFVAGCAVGLCCQTYCLLHVPVNKNLLGFVFFATICSYNFYWLLSKFYFSDNKTKLVFVTENYSFLLMWSIGTVGTVYALLRLQHLWLYILFGLLLTLLYSMPLWPFYFSRYLQRIKFFKTVLLAFTWAYVTTIIPAAQAMVDSLMPVGLLLAQRFLFMLLLCILFDLRDVSIDKLHGLHSLATDLSKQKVNKILWLVFASYLLLSMLFCWNFANSYHAVAFIVTGIVTWMLYRLSMTKRGHFFYYFLIDGLMLFTASATYLASHI